MQQIMCRGFSFPLHKPGIPACHCCCRYTRRAFYLSIHPSICLYIRRSVYTSIAFYLSIHPSTHQSNLPAILIPASRSLALSLTHSLLYRLYFHQSLASISISLSLSPSLSLTLSLPPSLPPSLSRSLARSPSQVEVFSRGRGRSRGGAYSRGMRDTTVPTSRAGRDCLYDLRVHD